MNELMGLNAAPTADLVSFDAEGCPVILVEIRGRTLRKLSERTTEYLIAAEPPSPFGMLVNRTSTKLIGGHGDPDHVVFTWNTADLLDRYDPEFSTKNIFHFYLTTLVEAWLRDLAFGWNSEHPPGEAEMAEHGLLSRLKGGTTRSSLSYHSS